MIDIVTLILYLICAWSGEATIGIVVWRFKTGEWIWQKAATQPFFLRIDSEGWQVGGKGSVIEVLMNVAGGLMGASKDDKDDK